MTFFRFPWSRSSSRRTPSSSGRKKSLFRQIALELELLERRWLPSSGITEYNTVTASVTPTVLVAGPDGDVWLLENTAKLAKFTTSGSGTEYNLPSGYTSFPAVGLTAGPDGNLWLSGGYSTNASLLKVSTSGTMTRYYLPSSWTAPNPQYITVGPDKNLWFTDNIDNTIEMSDTSGNMSAYTPNGYTSRPLSGSPAFIASGPDDALWFTEPSANVIGRMSTSFSLTEYSVSGEPEGIVTGPDGALWFTESSGNAIGRLTTSGILTSYTIPTSSSAPEAIAVGSDGALWFTENGSGKIGRLTTGGTFTEYTPPTSGSGPWGITSGPDNNIWFTEYSASKVGKFGWMAGGGLSTDDPTQAFTVAVGAAVISPLTGNVKSIAGPDQFGQNPSDCGCSNPKGSLLLAGQLELVNNSNAASVQPIIQSTLQTDPNGAVPSSVSVQLTWNNGTPQTAVSFDTSTGHSAGDKDVFAVQVSSAVTSTGYYPWSETLTITFTGDTITRTVSGNALVVVNGSGNPYGQGWGIAGVDELLSVTGGMIWEYGAGGGRFFANGPTSGTFLSPANDFGTLVLNSGTYTYTAPDQTTWNFSSAGLLTTIVDPHGLTATITYLSSPTRVSTITEPSGGVASFSYNGSNQLTQIAEPGGRTLTVGINASGDLATLTNPDASLRSFTYSNHQLVNDHWGQQSVSYVYNATTGAVATVMLDGSTSWKVAAEDTQGLATSPAKTASQVVGVLTDPRGNAGTYTLDSLGRLTKEVTADGSTQQWQRDFAGQASTYTDGNGNVSSYLYDYSSTGAGDLLEVQNPDGSTDQFQYNTTFHEVTEEIDGNANITTRAYNSTGDLTTLTNALNETSTYVYYQTGGVSNGLLMSETDPLGDTSSFAYDAARRVTEEIDGYGTAQAVTATMIYDSAGNLLSETTGISSTAAYDHHSTSSYAYDAMNRQTEMIQAYGSAVQETSSTVYTAQGDVLSTTDARGMVTSYNYDSQDRQTQVVTAHPIFERLYSKCTRRVAEKHRKNGPSQDAISCEC